MPHVELSVSEPSATRPRRPVEGSIDRWADATAAAAEPSLVINEAEVIVAISAPLLDLLGRRGDDAVGHGLLDVIRFLDFTTDVAELPEGEIVKIPPLLVLTSGGLARGLVRIHCAEGPSMFDAVAAALVQDGSVTGSLTFFSNVRL